ncbi:MAG TPA: thiamine phosphate synthase [bacterium]
MPNASSCSAWRLYVIIDRAAAAGRALTEIAAGAIRGGADVLQLRDKRAEPSALAAEARRLLALTRPAGIPLIINDHPDVAAEAGADGVHLGQDDPPVEAARARLGAGRLIGKSTHSLAQALAAEAEGADYLGYGPLFPTPTKPSVAPVGLGALAEVHRRVSRPVVCIGGIDDVRVGAVVAAGGRRIAVVRAVCSADDPAAAAARLRERLEEFLRTSTAGCL